MSAAGIYEESRQNHPFSGRDVLSFLIYLFVGPILLSTDALIPSSCSSDELSRLVPCTRKSLLDVVISELQCHFRNYFVSAKAT